MKVLNIVNLSKRNLCRIAIISFISSILVSCGVSYSIPRATLHIDIPEKNSMSIVREKISIFLLSKSFIDLGIHEEMLKLLEGISKKNESMVITKKDNYAVSAISRTRTFKNDEIKIEVTIVDYSDVNLKQRFVNYPTSESEITDSPSIEINIYNHRPGGFSADAHKFYQELYSFVTSEYNGQIHTIFSPPETNQSEFYKTKGINFISSAFWWLAVYLISISLFGLIIIKTLSKVKASINAKRVIFTLLCPMLATPLPFPAATIFVIVLPSFLAIPAIGTDYFTRIQDYAIPSLAVSITLSLLLSTAFIREKKSSVDG